MAIQQDSKFLSAHKQEQWQQILLCCQASNPLSSLFLAPNRPSSHNNIYIQVKAALSQDRSPSAEHTYYLAALFKMGLYIPERTSHLSSEKNLKKLVILLPILIHSCTQYTSSDNSIQLLRQLFLKIGQHISQYTYFFFQIKLNLIV